jgi:hypothetical protein
VTNDIDTLATVLYVSTDDLLKRSDLALWRPAIGLQPRLTDAKLVTLAVMQALLGYNLRVAVAAPRPGAPGAPVPLPAWPVRVQPAAARRGRADHRAHPAAGGRYQLVDR